MSRTWAGSACLTHSGSDSLSRSGWAFISKPMSLPPGMVPASIPRDDRLQIVTPCNRLPSGDGWLHEIEHDDHRLVAMFPGGRPTHVVSRNGYDRIKPFREPFGPLLDPRLPPMVLDGEIAVPDDRGVTHLDALP